MKRFQLPRVSIIGSAGRRGDGKKMTAEIYNRALDKAKEVIKDEFKLNLEKIHLVSGGAAWTGIVVLNNYDLVSAFMFVLKVFFTPSNTIYKIIVFSC